MSQVDTNRDRQEQLFASTPKANSKSTFRVLT